MVTAHEDEASVMSRTERQQVIANLRELIVALDRRVPHLERTGEVVIARDAAALRLEALRRIGELETEAQPGS